MGPFIDGADAEKQCPRRDAVVHHLHDRALDALGVEREDTQGDKAHVAHAGVRDQFFQICLRQGHVRAIQNRDQ